MASNISEWFYAYSPSDEEGESPSKKGTATATSNKCSGWPGVNDNLDWPLDDLMDDIEQQMNEQNDAIAGMTKQIEDIEASLAQHSSSRSPSRCFSAPNKNKSYNSMNDGKDKEVSLRGDLNVTIPSILRVFQTTSSFIGRRRGRRENVNSGPETDPPRSQADLLVVNDPDVATTTSSSTRQAKISSDFARREQRNSMTDSRAECPKLTPLYQTQKSQRHLTLLRGKSKLHSHQQERSPPPSLLRGATMNTRGHVSVSFHFPSADPMEQRNSTLKRLECGMTSVESESSGSPDEEDYIDSISELENTTITGSKTWATVRSSKAKVALLALSFTLVMLIGLFIGQWAQRRDLNKALQQSNQSQSQQQTPLNTTAAPSSDFQTVAPTYDVESSFTEASTTQTTPPPTVAPSITNQVTGAPTSMDEDNPTGYDYTARSDYLIGVYYYPWHGENFHNGGGYVRKELSPRHQPALGEYNDSDPTVIAQHMKWFRQANIGLLVTSWWGPNGLEDSNTKDVIMGHEHVGNLKIALHYETVGRLGEGTTKIENAKTDIEYMCEHYFDHPNYYKIDERPVIFIYISRLLEAVGTLEKALLTMRSTANKCGKSLFLIGDSVFESAPDPAVPHVPFWYFDAVTNYDVYGSAGRPEGHVGMERVDNYYLQQAEWKKQALKDECHYIPAVSPGYNDRGVRMQNDHPPLSRRITEDAEEGSLLHYQLQHAKELVDSKVDNMILVNSFNEWHEDTVSFFCDCHFESSTFLMNFFPC
jgi:glycoprotein endo-alpha-1,2-mannosidase